MFPSAGAIQIKFKGSYLSPPAGRHPQHVWVNGLTIQVEFVNGFQPNRLHPADIESIMKFKSHPKPDFLATCIRCGACEPRCSGCGYCEYHCPVQARKAIVVSSVASIRMAAGSYRREAQARGFTLEIGPRGSVPAIPPEGSRDLPPGFSR